MKSPAKSARVAWVRCTAKDTRLDRNVAVKVLLFGVSPFNVWGLALAPSSSSAARSSPARSRRGAPRLSRRWTRSAPSNQAVVSPR